MITIDEFMTAQPVTLSETDTLADAWRVMTEKHIRHIPITDSRHHLQGLVTQRDVLAATDPEMLKQGDIEADPHAATPLTDIMIRDVSTIAPGSAVRQAALFMQAHKFGCLPVTRDDELVGIITDTDFISIAINLLEQAEIVEEADSGFYDDDVLDEVGI